MTRECSSLAAAHSSKMDSSFRWNDGEVVHRQYEFPTLRAWVPAFAGMTVPEALSLSLSVSVSAVSTDERASTPLPCGRGVRRNGAVAVTVTAAQRCVVA